MTLITVDSLKTNREMKAKQCHIYDQKEDHQTRQLVKVGKEIRLMKQKGVPYARIHNEMNHEALKYTRRKI